MLTRGDLAGVWIDAFHGRNELGAGLGRFAPARTILKTRILPKADQGEGGPRWRDAFMSWLPSSHAETQAKTLSSIGGVFGEQTNSATDST